MISILRRLIRGKRNSHLCLSEKYPEYDIGKESYGNIELFKFGEDAGLKIGDYTSIANGVKIFLGGEHRMDWVTTFPFNVLWKEGLGIKGHPKTKGDVVIGSDVWIASNAVILSGVHIGDGAVIGANAVVSKNVPAYGVAAGNPSKVVKYRFDEDTIAQLLNIKWWEWDRQRIKNALPVMLDNDLKKFIQGVNEGVY